MYKGIDPELAAFLIDMDAHVQAEARTKLVAKRPHLTKLPKGIDMKKGEGWTRRPEGFQRKVRQNRRVLADGIQEDRVFERGDDFSENEDRFRFDRRQVVWKRAWARPAIRLEPLGIGLDLTREGVSHLATTFGRVKQRAVTEASLSSFRPP